MLTVKNTFAIVLCASLTACGGSRLEDSNISSSSIASSLAKSSSSSAVVISSSVAAKSSVMSSASSAINSLALGGIVDVNYGGFSGVYTFLDNGTFSGLHFINGTTLAGHPYGILSEVNTNTHREHISWANFIDGVDGFGFQEPNGMFGRTLTTSAADVSITGLGAAPGVVFSATASKQKTYSATDLRSLYNDPLPLATIAGTYTGIMRTVGINKPITNVTDFIVNANGVFTVNVINCTFTGTLLQHGTTGVFDVQATVSGTSCLLANPLKGLVVPLAVNDNKPQLSVQLDDLNHSQSAVFIINK